MLTMIKTIVNCCQLQIVFKSTNRLSNTSKFKNRIPKIFTSDAYFNLQYGPCHEPR